MTIEQLYNALQEQINLGQGHRTISAIYMVDVKKSVKTRVWFNETVVPNNGKGIFYNFMLVPEVTTNDLGRIASESIETPTESSNQNVGQSHSV